MYIYIRSLYRESDSKYILYIYSYIYKGSVYMIVYEYIPDICAIVRRLSFLQCCLCPHEFYKLCVTRILPVNGILYTHMLYIYVYTDTYIHITYILHVLDALLRISHVRRAAK